MARRKPGLKTGPSKNLKRKKSATALRRANAVRATGVGGELSGLRDNFGQLTRQLEGFAANSGGAALDLLRGQLDNFASSVDGVVGDVQRRGRKAAGAVNDFRGNMVGTVEDAVRLRPLTTVALAIGLGFVLSSTMRR